MVKDDKYTKPPDRPVFYSDIDIMTNKHDGEYQSYELYRNIAVLIKNVHQNGRGLTGDIGIQAPDYGLEIDNIEIHLKDFKKRDELSKDLSRKTAFDINNNPIPWDKILDTSISKTIALYRGLPEIMDASAAPSRINFPSIIDGLKIPVGLQTTIFSPGGKGKSIFVWYLAHLLQYGLIPDEIPFLIPRQANVLIIDWEADVEVYQVYSQAIRKSLGITEIQNIDYLHGERSIFEMADGIKELIRERKIEFIIIDSQMAATAGGTQFKTDADKDSEYYNIMQSFGCTGLTIDHVTKENMKSDNNTGAAYGSVVKYNRARSQYELKSQQDADSDHLEFALIHTKYNLGRKQKPFGIAVDFENIKNQETGEDELISLKFSTCDLADNPELEKSLPLKDRIKSLLLESGLMTVEEIAAALEAGDASVRTTLNKPTNKKMFTKNGNKWGVLIFQEDEKRNVTRNV